MQITSLAQYLIHKHTVFLSYSPIIIILLKANVASMEKWSQQIWMTCSLIKWLVQISPKTPVIIASHKESECSWKEKKSRLKHHIWSYIYKNDIENYREQKRKINIKTICRHLEKKRILYLWRINSLRLLSPKLLKLWKTKRFLVEFKKEVYIMIVEKSLKFFQLNIQIPDSLSS